MTTTLADADMTMTRDGPTNVLCSIMKPANANALRHRRRHHRRPYASIRAVNVRRTMTITWWCKSVTAPPEIAKSSIDLSRFPVPRLTPISRMITIWGVVGRTMMIGGPKNVPCVTRRADVNAQSHRPRRLRLLHATIPVLADANLIVTTIRKSRFAVVRPKNSGMRIPLWRSLVRQSIRAIPTISTLAIAGTTMTRDGRMYVLSLTTARDDAFAQHLPRTMAAMTVMMKTTTTMMMTVVVTVMVMEARATETHDGMAMPMMADGATMMADGATMIVETIMAMMT